jgi:hypothetical protein
VAALTLTWTSGCGGPRLVEVDCLWVGPTSGGVAPASITLVEHKRSRLRVAVVEDTSLGTGQAWRASVWMAAFQAALAVDVSPSRWFISVDVHTDGQGIDGPSAGGLLTAAMMAGMTRARVRDDFTMTGTVNPDGTIGPVLGIRRKVEAAIAAGKTVVGYPRGQGDQVSGMDPPGVRLVPVTDVYEAYEYLTGRSAGRRDPVPVSAMVPPRLVSAAMLEGAREWLKRGRADIAAYRQLGLSHRDLEHMIEAAERQDAMARTDLKAGRVAAGYWRGVNMATRVRAAHQIGRLVGATSAGDPAAAAAILNEVRDAADSALHRASQRVAAATPTSAADLACLVDAHEALVSSLRGHQSGSRSMTAVLGLLRRTTGSPEDDAVSMGISAVYDLSVAATNARVAEHNLTFRPPRGLAPVPDSRIDRLSGVLNGAARANLAYFEASVGNEEAFRDPSYQSARTVERIVQGPLAVRLRHKTPQHIGKLAGALSVYINAALLIARSVAGRGLTLDTMLEVAERSAREHAARALATVGEIPAAARIAYRIAVAYRQRVGTADKLEALEHFWRASLFSRMVVLLRPRS